MALAFTVFSGQQFVQQWPEGPGSQLSCVISAVLSSMGTCRTDLLRCGEMGLGLGGLLRQAARRLSYSAPASLSLASASSSPELLCREQLKQGLTPALPAHLLLQASALGLWALPGMPGQGSHIYSSVSIQAMPCLPLLHTSCKHKKGKKHRSYFQNMSHFTSPTVSPPVVPSMRPCYTAHLLT